MSANIFSVQFGILELPRQNNYGKCTQVLAVTWKYYWAMLWHKNIKTLPPSKWYRACYFHISASWHLFRASYSITWYYTRLTCWLISFACDAGRCQVYRVLPCMPCKPAWEGYMYAKCFTILIILHRHCQNESAWSPNPFLGIFKGFSQHTFFNGIAYTVFQMQPSPGVNRTSKFMSKVDIDWLNISELQQSRSRVELRLGSCDQAKW